MIPVITTANHTIASSKPKWGMPAGRGVDSSAVGTEVPESLKSAVLDIPIEQE